MSQYSNPTIVVFEEVSELVPTGNPTAVPQPFSALSDMLAANPAEFLTAVNANFDPGDGQLNVWLKVASAPPPDPNGTSIIQTLYPGDTSVFLKIYP